MEVQYRVSVRGALCLPVLIVQAIARRYTVHISNPDINPGCVGAMHCCKAPLCQYGLIWRPLFFPGREQTTWCFCFDRVSFLSKNKNQDILACTGLIRSCDRYAGIRHVPFSGRLARKRKKRASKAHVKSTESSTVTSKLRKPGLEPTAV